MLEAFLRGFGRRMAGGRGTPRLRSATRDGDATPPTVIKEPPLEIDGRVMSVSDFVRYVESLAFPSPLPTRIFVHHTWIPRKEDWAGHDTILAMKSVYETRRWQDGQGQWHEGWDAGPHLFVAEDGIWLFSDLRFDGVGVYGQNYRSRHLEIVGDYDNETPSGAILTNTIAALGILHEKLGLDIRRLNFHRDFATNSCPGRAIEKGWLIPQVQEWLTAYRKEQQEQLPALRQRLKELAGGLLVPTNPDFALAKAARERGLLGAISSEIPMEVEGRGYVVQFFAEALLVPVNEWDQAQSLREFEARPTSSARGLRGEERTSEECAPPHDPFDFQGKIR
jgi:hypothetical protein